MRTAARPEAIRTVQKVLLVDHLEHLAYCILDDLVLQALDADRSGLAPSLRDVREADRLVPPSPRLQPPVKVLEIALQLLPVFRLGHPIDPHRCVFTQSGGKPAPVLAHRSDAPVRGSSPSGAPALLPLPSEVPVTCAPMSSHRTSFPPEAHVSTDRLRSAGSRYLPVPRLLSYFAVLRLLFPFGRRSGRPSQTAYHLVDASSSPRRGCAQTCAGSEVGYRTPRRSSRWRYEAFQGSGPSSCSRAAIPNPAPCAPISPPNVGSATAFEIPSPLGSGNTHLSAPTHAAHSLACLRIAGYLTAPAQGSPPACRAQLWPGGIRTRWTAYRISEVPLLLPPDQSYLVASRY